MKKENQENNNNTTTQNTSYTPLIDTVISGNVEEVKKFIESDKRLVDEKTSFGNTALLFAAQFGHLDIVEYLISQGANQQHRNEAGWNAFLYAVSGGHITLMKYLIKEKMFTPEDINMAVIISASRRYFHFDTLRFLLGYFSIQISDTQQLTALAENSYYGKKQGDSFDGWALNLRSTKELILLENNSPLLKELKTNQVSANENFMFKSLEKNEFIEKLTFYSPWTTPENFKHLLTFLERTPSLKELCLMHCDSVSVEKIFSTMSKNKNLTLESLECWDCVINDHAQIMALRKLISSNESLRHLSIQRCDLSASTTKEIVDAILARRIALISDEMIKAAMHNPSMMLIVFKTLRLTSARIGLPEIKAIASLLEDPYVTLEELDLHANFELKDSMAKIVEAATKNTYLSKLVLTDIWQDMSKTIAAICRLLVNNPTLTELDIRDSYFTDEQGAEICAALGENSGLRKINFSRSNPQKMFSEKTANALNKALAQNTTIEAIDFSGHKEFGKYIKHFTEGLAKNKSLKQLDFGYTDIDNENFFSLIDTIYSNLIFSSLKVNSAKIGKESIKKLAGLLAENKVPLQRLSLPYINLDEESYLTLFESLRKNTSLTDLTVGYNSFHTNVTIRASEYLIKVLQESNFTLREVCGCRGEAQEVEINKLLERNKQLAENPPKNGSQVFSIFSDSEGKKEEEKTDEEKALAMNKN